MSDKGLEYHELYGLLAENFDYIRLVAQCPVAGYVMADLQPDDSEPPITFDPSLLEEGSEEAEIIPMKKVAE
jgi:hypothetical protein